MIHADRGRYPVRVVVFVPYSRWRYFETDLELIQQHVSAGDQVTVLTCQGSMHACDSNLTHRPYRCVRCIARRQHGLELISGDFEVRDFHNLSLDECRRFGDLKTDIFDHAELTKIVVDNFDLGWAVLSSFISHYRDPEIDLREYADQLDGLLRGAWTVYYSLRGLLRDKSIDRVYVHNGRFATLRAILRACQAEQVDCFVHDLGRDFRHYALYKNALPHDHQVIARTVREQWHSHEAQTNREEIGASWFVQRARGDQELPNVFVAEQVDGLLPDDWDERRRNVAVFLSSEDEFVAIGDSWKNPLYESQLDGLQHIIRSLEAESSDLHLYVRVHPNLKGVENQQTEGLARLESSQITLIPAEAPVSTYKLMRECEKTLTFGSTAGIEAVYWGKPSILAGISFYRDLEATYNPHSHEELMNLLRQQLEPRDRLPALMYGFYQATLGSPYCYFCPTRWFSGRFNGRRVRLPVASMVKSQLVKFWPNLGPRAA
jgi:hypothetical protein